MKKYLLVVFTLIVGLFSYNNVFGQCVVTSLADDGGGGTLRSIIGSCPAGNTITFDAAINGGTIQLVEQAWDYSSLSIEKELTIDGSGSNITIIGSTQSGNPTPGPDNVFNLGYVGSGDPSNSTIRGLTILGGAEGIHIEGNGTDVVTGITIEDNIIGSAAEPNFTHGIFAQDVENLTVTGNNVSYNGRHGIQLNDVSGGTVENNTSENNEWDGLNLGFGTNGLTVNDNQLNNNGLNGAGDPSLPDAAGEGRAMYIGDSFNNTFTNNSMTGNYYHGALFNNSADNILRGNTISDNGQSGAFDLSHGITLVNSSNNNVIDDNTITDNPRNGIEIIGSSNNNSVTDNTIDNNGSGNGGSGVLIQDGSSNTTISGNDITNSEMGIQLNPNGTGVITNTTVTGNNLDGNTLGLQIINSGSSVQTLEVTNNNIINSGSDGVQLLTTIDDLTFDGNDISNSGDYGVNIGPTASITNASFTTNTINSNGASGLNMNNVDGLEIGVAGQENIIGGNGTHGIEIFNSDNVELNNFVGVDNLGNPIPNGQGGVYVTDSDNLEVSGGEYSGNTLDGLLINNVPTFSVQNSSFGVEAPNLGYGLQVVNSSGTVQSNTFQQNDLGGILINGVNSQVTVEQNTIGGVASNGNGITVNGGTNTINDNDITAHAVNGIEIGGGTNTITTNRINNNVGSGIVVNNGTGDTQIDDNTIEDNDGNGVAVIGAGDLNSIGSTTRNIIGGNGENGVYVENSGITTIENNYIGTDVTGNVANANDGSGVFLYDLANDGTSVVGNTIAGNGIHGIQVEDVTGGATIRTNNIGVGEDGTTVLGNTSNGIDILNSQAIYAQENLIANNIEGVNLNTSSSNTFDANTIGANSANGISISGASDDNNINSNYIGLQSDGSDFSNGAGAAGIHVQGGDGNEIGTRGRNFIGGTTQDYGILADGGTATQISDNLFGKTTPAGTENSPVENAVYVNGADVNTVSGNVFSHAGKDAVVVNNGTVTNSITGNYFGVDDDGLTPITGAPSSAVILEGGSSNITVENNVVAETTSDAIIIRDASSNGNTISSNNIGVFSDGTSAGAGSISGSGVLIQNAEGSTVSSNIISNAVNGISVEDVASGNTSIDANTIGNNTTGVALTTNTTGVTISNNFIGTDAAGSTTDIGNDIGINITSGSNGNIISTNTIAYNSNNGVLVDGAASTGNQVTQNSMYCNQGSNSTVGTGITNTAGGNNQTTDLFSASFADFPPFIFSNSGSYSLEVRNDSLDVYGITTDLTTGNYTLEVFSIDTECDNCQGETYEGTMSFDGSAGASGGFSFTLPDANSTYVVTITDNTNNTSFFSACSKTAPCTAPDSLIVTDLLSGNRDSTEICLDLTADEFDLLADPYVAGAIDGDPDNNFNYTWYVDGAEQNNGSRDSTLDYTTAPEAEYYRVRAYSISDELPSNPDKFKDVPGCYVEDSILVTVHELPEFTLTQDEEICLGESAPLTVTLTQGVSPFEFEWQDDQTTGPTPITDVMDDTTWSVTPSTAVDHVYTLASLTDNNGCMATPAELGAESATIQVNPLPSATISNITDDEICYNTSTDLTIDFTGAAPFTLGYYASTSDTFTVSSPTNQLNPFSTGNLTQDTTYHLFYVQDDNNCIDTITTESQFIRVYPEVTAAISGNNTICQGVDDSIIIAFTGTAPFDYVYSMNTVNQPPVIGEPSDTALIFNTYLTQGTFTYELVSVEDQFGCPATTLDGTAVKTVNAVPTANITGEEDPCFNVNEQYTATSIPGNSYQWDIFNDPLTTTGAANFVDGITTGEEINLDFTSAGEFKLRVVEYVGAPSATACQDTFVLDITVIDTINFGFSLAEVCNEVDDYQFDASNVTISPTATWNGSPYTSNNIQYFRNGTDVTASGIDPSLLTAGTYDILSTQTLDATDGGCVSRQEATLVINETPQNVSISPEDTLICESASVTLVGSADINSGTITDTYKGTGVSGDVFDATAAGVGATNTVWYVATSNKGCKDSVSTTVNTTPPLAPDFTASQDDPVCEDLPQTFIATRNNDNFGTNPVYEWRIGTQSGPPAAVGQTANLDVVAGTSVFLNISPGSDAVSCLTTTTPPQIEVVATTIKRPDITDVSVIPLTKTKYCIGSSIDLASLVEPATINDLSTEYDWIKVNQSNSDTTVLLSGSTQTNITDIGDLAGTFNYTVYVTNIKGTGSCSSSLASSSIQVVEPEVVAYAGNTQGQLVTQNAYALQNETIYLDATHPTQASNYSNYEWTLVSIENRLINEFVDDQKSTTNIPEVMEEDKNVLYEVSTERTDVDPGCTATDTVSVRLRATCFVPNGFTPNGDGQNDTWNIECLNDGDYPNAIVKIFNRWGELIYKDERGYRVPWDGTRNGEIVPVGTYYFAIDLNDGYEEIAGAVGIIR